MYLESMKSRPRRAVEKAIRYFKYWINRYVRGIRIEYPPVYIVGCGHSGTTLLLAILDAHSKIHGVPFESGFANHEEINEQQSSMRQFDRRAIASGKLRWVEKTPNHIHRIQKLLSLREGSKVIVMVRDGRDVACSLHARPYDFELACKMWLDDNRAAQEFYEHENVIPIKYEDLITDLEGTLRRVVKFLGMEFEEHLLTHNKKAMEAGKPAPDIEYKGEIHRQYRNWQVAQPVFDGRYKWKQKMTEEQKATFKRVANELLIEFGYASDSQW